MRINVAVILCFWLFFSGVSPAMAQERPIDPFPRISLGGSGGFFRPMLDELKDRHRKSLEFGAHLGVRLFKTTPRQGAYATVQLYTFGATRLGAAGLRVGRDSTGLLKWDMLNVNVGMRYVVRLFEGHTLSWIGSGVSSIALHRRDISIRNVQISLFQREEMREVKRDTFRSTSFYVELGQMVQSYFFKAKPRVGLFWNAKYDHGRSKEMDIGGLSVQAGIFVGL
ncbi:MAG: hypothetical protein ACE5G0_22595 [Rhodothermales bacterium]